MVGDELVKRNENYLKMSKILAIADIHIHDYPQRNPSDKFRLMQTRVVAQNIIEAAHNEGCDILVIDGDLIEKSIIRPYVQAEVKYFLDTVMPHFKVGYIIWGNHDLDAKTSDQEFTDACLAVMLPPNLYYADKQQIQIENTKIAFSNWRPEFDLSWINGSVDVLFTHATISYAKEDLVQSQILDESKFDLAICGDIHKPGSTGKYVSIGIPQRCKMSDGEVQTGVIYDCQAKAYKWVDLNPHDNLMKFQYTSEREKEGWDPTTGTWSIYKPASLGLTSGNEEIKVPAWEEIDNLINGIIVANNLEKVHGEVLQNLKDVDAKEVDFNFTLTRFYCKNWRSIDEAELFFGPHDKILITGKNGSGKSSLLSAIKYAFLENRSIKDFIQFGTKECLTEVEFTYQGIGYKIQRGSKKYGFWIDGELQKYNNKGEFEKDMHTRFPFIDYMDVYFFDSDHHKLIGGISPERKSEVISKFFKMDKIDAFNEEALHLLELKRKKGIKWTEEKDKEEKLLAYIESKLGLISVPSLTEEILEAQKQEGLEMQRKWVTYNDYMTMTANLQASKKSSESRVAELLEATKDFRNPEVIQKEKEDKELYISQISQKFQELSDIKSEGKQLFYKRQDLDKVKVCPSCGQTIKNSDQLDSHKAELDAKIQELVEKQNNVYSYLQSLGIGRDIVDSKGGFAGVVSGYNQEIASCIAELNLQQRTYQEIEQAKNNLDAIKRQLSALAPEPEKIELPSNFMETMGRIEADLAIWGEYNSLRRDKSEAEMKISACEKELSLLQNEIVDIQDYIKLTGTTGKIYEEIMTRLANQFTDNQVKYEVMVYKFRNKDHLDLASYFINNGNQVGYQACSSGQQTVLDINFLSKIVTGMGLLVMDEFLKHLDPYNHDLCIDAISQMNIGCIMLSSHMESIAAFNNKSIKMELNESAVTKLSCE